MFLLKQHFADKVDEEDMIENAFTAWLLKHGYATEEEVNEEVMGIGAVLEKGSYKLNLDIFAGNEGDIKGKKGDVVIAFADTTPDDTVLGQEIFKVIHQKSKSEIYVSLEDLEEK